MTDPTFTRAYPPAAPASGPALWLPFRDGALCIESDDTGARLIHADSAEPPAPAKEPPLYLGTLDTLPCLTYTLAPDAALLNGWQTVNLRALYGRVSDAEYVLAGYAAQMVEWQRASVFCSVCATPTVPHAGDWGRQCPNCGYTRYPPVSPAVLILIHDGDNILLGHRAGWSSRYSILAGFVEPGETLEECAAREAMEEANVRVADITYHRSQSWPFPHQIMLGFTMRYAGGEVRPDTTELDDVRWFRYDALPDLPPPLSLSRQLIDAWVASRTVQR